MRKSPLPSRLTDHCQVHGGALSSSYTTVNYILGECPLETPLRSGMLAWKDRTGQMNIY